MTAWEQLSAKKRKTWSFVLKELIIKHREKFKKKPTSTVTEALGSSTVRSNTAPKEFPATTRGTSGCHTWRGGGTTGYSVRRSQECCQISYNAQESLPALTGTVQPKDKSTKPEISWHKEEYRIQARLCRSEFWLYCHITFTCKMRIIKESVL